MPPPSPADQLCDADTRALYQARRRQMGAPDTANEAIVHSFLTEMIATQGSSRVGARRDATRELLLASRRWPDNVDLAWLVFRHCFPETNCDRAQAWQRLAALDSDNAATWTSGMELARARRDDVGFAQALHRGAQSAYFDSRRRADFPRLFPLFQTLPLPRSCATPEAIKALEDQMGRPLEPDDVAALLASLSGMSLAFDPHPELSACESSAAALDASRRHDCIALLSRIAAGESMADQLQGLSRLVRLVPTDARGAGVRERYRQLLWLAKYQRRPKVEPRFSLEDWTEGEVERLQGVATGQGHWPPPRDWLPDDPVARAWIRPTSTR